MRNPMILFVGVICAATVASCASTDRSRTHTGETAEPSSPTSQAALKTPISFAPSARVRKAVRDGCDLPGQLGYFIRQMSAERNIAVREVENRNTTDISRFLTVEITRARARANVDVAGAMVTIEGELSEDGKTVGTFKARRVTDAGLFGSGYLGGAIDLCSYLDQSAEALGEDVARFLIDPKMDTYMGRM